MGFRRAIFFRHIFFPQTFRYTLPNGNGAVQYTNRKEHSLSTVTLPGETAAPASHKTDLARIIILAVLFATLSAFFLAFTTEKLTFLYKEQLHLTPGGVGTMLIIVGIPLYLQPLMGAFSDLNPLGGYHRRSYYVLGGLLGAFGFLCLAMQTHYLFAIVAALVIIGSAGATMASVIFNAVLVVAGNATGTFGRLQTLLYLVVYGWSLAFTGKLTGQVTQNWSYKHTFEAAALVCLLLTLLVFLIPETRRVGRTHTDPAETARLKTARSAERRQTLATLKSAASSPGLWAIVLLVFYLIVTPGTITAQVYYETDALHLSKQFIGSLNRWAAVGVLTALALYGAASRWISPRMLVGAAWLMDMSIYLALMNIHNAQSAEWMTLLTALLGTVYGLCLYTLAGRACPVGVEGVVYGLVLAAIALGGTLGEKLGGTLYDSFGPASHHSVAHGWMSLLWFGFGLTSLAAGLFPFLPAWARGNERLSAVQEPAA